MPSFPRSLEVFLPLIDGFHPIAAADLNDVQSAIERVQSAMGHGVASTLGPATTYGPKGGNADVADRITRLFEDDGSLRDVAFVTGSMRTGLFSPLNSVPAFIGFGKRLSSTDYSVIWQSWSTVTEGSPNANVDALAVWIPSGGRLLNGVHLVGTTTSGVGLLPENTRTTKFALIAFGPLAYY